MWAPRALQVPEGLLQGGVRDGSTSIWVGLVLFFSWDVSSLLVGTGQEANFKHLHLMQQFGVF